MSASKPIRVLVVDDEQPGRQRLVDLLAQRGDCELAAVCSDGKLASAAIDEHAPDLVLLDIQMPGLSGLEVVRRLGGNAPHTIFVTAYAEHALTAFELAAVDYILKPFTEDRFNASVDRAIELIRSARTGARLATLQHLLKSRDGRVDTHDRPWPQRVAVESRGRLRIVALNDVTHITADGPYVNLHAGDTTHLVRVRIKDLETRLDPQSFWRIHRSTMVNVDAIESLNALGAGDYVVRLKSGEELRLSRTFRDELSSRMALL